MCPTARRRNPRVRAPKPSSLPADIVISAYIPVRAEPAGIWPVHRPIRARLIDFRRHDVELGLPPGYTCPVSVRHDTVKPAGMRTVPGMGSCIANAVLFVRGCRSASSLQIRQRSPRDYGWTTRDTLTDSTVGAGEVTFASPFALAFAAAVVLASRLPHAA